MLIGAAPAVAQAPVGPPPFRLMRIATPDLPGQIPLYPSPPPRRGSAAERWGDLAAVLPDGSQARTRIVRNVAVPTMTPVLPDPAKATGAAVVVAPGGGFLSLSMDSEGFEVARRFADQGIAAFVLKYRTNPVPDDEGAFMARVGEVMAGAARPGAARDIADPDAGPDALQALRLVRGRAAEWHVDPARVGMIGFSAGAMTTLLAVTTGSPADRPAFFGFIYGPMDRIPVPAAAPPMFAALAQDDPLFGGRGYGIVEAWHAAGRPVELHVYERGGHGFGTGQPGTTTTLLMPEFVEWLRDRGLLAARR